MLESNHSATKGELFYCFFINTLKNTSCPFGCQLHFLFHWPKQDKETRLVCWRNVSVASMRLVALFCWNQTQLAFRLSTVWYGWDVFIVVHLWCWAVCNCFSFISISFFFKKWFIYLFSRPGWVTLWKVHFVLKEVRRFRLYFRRQILSFCLISQVSVYLFAVRSGARGTLDSV